MEYIYQIINLQNGKFYLGSTIEPRKRMLRHFNELRKNKHHSIYLQRAFNKYKEHNFIFVIIETCYNSKKREQELLNKINFKDCYNVSKSASGGDLISNHPNKKEIIKKTTSALLNAPKRTKSFKGKNNPNWRGGTTFFKCPSCGKEYRTTNKQKVCVNCRDMSGEKNPFYGKKHSDKTKEKLRKARKNNYSGKQEKPVIINNIEFKSLSEAARQLNVCPATIRYRIKSSNSKYDNYHYK